MWSFVEDPSAVAFTIDKLGRSLRCCVVNLIFAVDGSTDIAEVLNFTYNLATANVPAPLP